MTEAPDFSPVAESYAAARPGYPPELFTWLASVSPGRGLAWDAATGSGQAAVGLAAHFDRVIATDRSEAQLRHARPHPSVEYRMASAEASGLPDHAVDLVTVAAAIHWFDLERFAEEARRVGRPGAVLAAWTYHVAHVEPPFDRVLWPFYRDVVRSYFAPGARLVDDRYEAIALPGTPLESPEFETSARWTSADILRFVGTWSGVQAYREATGVDPVPGLAPALEGICGGGVHEIRWPIYLRAARL